MKPHRSVETPQDQLFLVLLIEQNFVNEEHEPVRSSWVIDWEALDAAVAKEFSAANVS